MEGKVFKICSTPVLDLIKYFPAIAEILFYKLITLTSKKTEKTENFYDYNQDRLVECNTINFNYEKFDNSAEIKAWHKEEVYHYFLSKRL
jgi:hypothetical protein